MGSFLRQGVRTTVVRCLESVSGRGKGPRHRGGVAAKGVCLPPLGHSSGETINTSDTTHGRVADRIVPVRSRRRSYSRRGGGLILVGGLADWVG